MRILIATDAWSPQVNGVVRTLTALIAELRQRGHHVTALTPEGRRSLPLPFYTEIGLTRVTAKEIGREIDEARPQAIHIVTEGPIGWAARKACLRRGLPFTTAFHTRFAEYAAARLPVPGVKQLGWLILRHFHKPSQCGNGADPARGGRTCKLGFSEPQGVDPRRGSLALPSLW